MSVKTIPKTEKIWQTCHVSDHERFYITSKINNRDTYFLYHQTDDQITKIAKHANPNVLHQKYIQPLYDAVANKR